MKKAKYQEWTELEVAVDTGACDIVMHASACIDIPVVESEGRTKGIEYEVANGSTLPNQGERNCLMMTVGASSPKASRNKRSQYIARS